jgi:deoxyadenosine/deoxycytidine kinase
MKIVIDGNIGSSKSTQLNLLEKAGFAVKREPIEDWPLELYYSDPERWGLAFQLRVLQSHSELIPDVPLCIYERFPSSGASVFWPLMKKTKEEDAVFQHIHNLQKWTPDVYIYLDVPPKLCFKRIQDRNQDGDSSVTLEYLETLDKQYEKMFNELENCKKYIIDADDSVDAVHDQIIKIIQYHHEL